MSAPSRHRRSRRAAATLAALIVVLLFAAAGWLASRAVFFIGTDARGVVTIYRGLPYDLPVGIRLYERWYSSNTLASQVPQPRRRHLLDHTLRSRNDAADLVRRLELGELR